MIALGHAGSGAIVGASIVAFAPDTMPLSLTLADAFVLGMLVHYLGDFIPHGHYRFDLIKHPGSSLMKLFFDLVVSFSVLTLLSYIKYDLSTDFFIVLTAMIGAITPDIIEELVNLSIKPNNNFVNAHRAFHYDILHWHNNPKSPLEGGALPLKWYDIWQFAVFGFGVLLLI
jgi:hypothetical protein